MYSKLRTLNRVRLNWWFGIKFQFSDHEDIKVILEEPKYEKDSDNLKMSDGKLLEWKFNLNASEKKEVPFRFAIERPEGTIIQGL
jgi:hypothetical protein